VYFVADCAVVAATSTPWLVATSLTAAAATLAALLQRSTTAMLGL
jgi:hypothetical protein